LGTTFSASNVPTCYRSRISQRLMIKIQTFLNALRESSLYVISCLRQPVVKELDKIHFLHARKFGDLFWESGP